MCVAEVSLCEGVVCPALVSWKLKFSLNSLQLQNINKVNILNPTVVYKPANPKQNAHVYMVL